MRLASSTSSLIARHFPGGHPQCCSICSRLQNDGTSSWPSHFGTLQDWGWNFSRPGGGAGGRSQPGSKSHAKAFGSGQQGDLPLLLIVTQTRVPARIHAYASAQYSISILFFSWYFWSRFASCWRWKLQTSDVLTSTSIIWRQTTLQQWIGTDEKLILISAINFAETSFVGLQDVQICVCMCMCKIEERKPHNLPFYCPWIHGSKNGFENRKQFLPRWSQIMM